MEVVQIKKRRPFEREKKQTTKVSRGNERRRRRVFKNSPFEPSFIFLNAAISVKVHPPRKKTIVVETWSLGRPVRKEREKLVSRSVEGRQRK